MKKLLAILGAAGIVASSSATVVACGDPKPTTPELTTKEKMEALVKDFNEIFSNLTEKGEEFTEKNPELDPTKDTINDVKIKEVWNQIIELTVSLLELAWEYKNIYDGTEIENYGTINETAGVGGGKTDEETKEIWKTNSETLKAMLLNADKDNTDKINKLLEKIK